MKKGLLVFILVLFLSSVFVYIYFIPRYSTVISSPFLDLYVSDTCPHCKEVEDYINKNNINKDNSIRIKEVTKHPDYSRELALRAKKCGIDASELVVPFLSDGGKCIAGTDDIISLLKKKVAISIIITPSITVQSNQND